MSKSAGSARRSDVDDTRSERIDFRTTRGNKELIERAASALGRSVSDFAVSTLVEAAGRVVREHDVLTLSMRDQIMLAEALLAPPAPPPRLAAAARRYAKGDRTGRGRRG